MAVIPKPDVKLISNALHYAETLREIDDDHHGVAHVLLYLAEYSRQLKTVTDAADQYMRFGQDVQLHTNLTKALEKLAAYELEAERLEPPTFGLD
ncbi:MAG TPA: hypothetical protein VFM76_01560 [Methylophaga sp.]|nr:hypothetical protein [Methylophaga sp.]